MIRLYVPGFYDSDTGKPRWGDATIIDDGTNFEVIDGYCSIGTTRLIKRLKDRGIKSPYLYISHAHWDHYHGIKQIIRDTYFTPKALYCYKPSSLVAKTVYNNDAYGYVKNEIATMNNIIAEAKKRNIPVIYLNHGDKIKHGDIEFYVYRKQPTVLYKDDTYGDAYINDGSLMFWFKNIGYMTSGDGSERIYDLCKSVGAKPKFFKIPHHGNACSRSQANGLKADGALYCWDNDYSTYITDFLRYGRNRCIEAGIKYISCHGDINAIFKGGYGVIYKGTNKYTYKCQYIGKTSLKGANATVVRKTMRGTYGNGDTRVTNLIDLGYYPVAVQNKVNEVVSTAKNILNGKVNYGKNEARIAKIDSIIGKGYGQLVQDYINVLCGVRKSV